MPISIVPDSEWEGLQLLFSDLFGGMPAPNRARILGYYGDGLEGGIVCENLLNIGMPFVRPDCKGKNIPGKLIDYLEAKCAEEKACAVAIASEERFEKLLESKGMWRVAGSLWRRDFDGD